jgi:hypothetical protein
MQIDDVSVQACRVPTSLPQNSFDAQANQPAIDNSAPQTFAAKNVTLTGTEADVEVSNVSAYGFSFGRLGGLLAVLGIAGAALVLLPLARRYSQ